MKRNWALNLVIMAVLVISIPFFLSGCGLRFAPSQEQKQSAALHSATIDAVGQAVGQAVAAGKLDGSAITLCNNADRQADALLAFVGIPDVWPDTSSIDALLNDTVTAKAAIDATQRPQIADVVDAAAGGLDLMATLATALTGAGLIAGGSKIVTALNKARTTAIALREIVVGNSKYLAQLEAAGQDAQIATFKLIQSGEQNKPTELLVKEIKVANPIVTAKPVSTA